MSKNSEEFVAWFKSLTRDHGMTGVVLLLSLLFVGLFAFQFFPAFNLNPSPVLNLAGTWEFCVSDSQETKGCQWNSIKIPSDIPKKYLSDFKGWVIYKVKFNTPDICEEQKSACSFYFGEIGDAAEAHLNGKFIGRHGQFPPDAVYAKHYPVSFQIPKETLKLGEKSNELQITAYSMKKTQAGVRAPPVAIYMIEDAFKLTQSSIIFNVVVPVLAFVALFVIAVLSLATAGPELLNDPKFLAFVRYGLASSCFLLSISEIPREYIPIGTAGFLHFCLRILSDWSFFEFVGAYFEYRPKFMKIFRPFYILTILAFIVQFFIFFFSGDNSTLLGQGFDAGFMTLRIAVPLLILPHVMGIVSGFKNRKLWDGKMVLTTFVTTLLFQIHDSTIFHGFGSGIYYVKWYPLLIGFIFGLFFLEKARENRTKEKVVQEQARQMHAIHEVMVGLAHDLEEPFKGIEMAFTELKRNPSNPELVRSIANNFPKKASAVFALNRTILNYSKELSTPVSLNLRQQNLKNFLDSVAQEYQANPKYSSVKFDLSCAESLELRFDPFQFIRVLRNLINNAVEAGATTVSVSVAEVDSTVEITLCDNGSGIPVKIKDRLFKPFATFGKEQGHGLGLNLSRRIIQAHRGDLTLTSSDSGSGACFRISLPVS